jgi:hypothetical protein
MRFNVFRKAKETVNYHQATAYVLDERTDLYSTVVTTSLSDKFYEATDNRVDRIRALIAKNDPAFVARLAIYTRNKMYMRSIPLVLAVELAKTQSGNGIVRKTVKGVIQRADEITELLAYYQLANQRTGTKKLNKLSKQIQHGLSDAFNRFDEYQFAKYDRAAEIKLKDALFIVHPKAENEAQQTLFNKIAQGTLETPYTWETELSALGQQKFANDQEKRAAFRITWEALIASGKLGYMALLRNLRNILEAEVSAQSIEQVCATLSNIHAVAKSKQLPFRFLAAYREIKEVQSEFAPKILGTLETAVS